jgi:tetratricopeptide (TPR) repeat protein
VSWLGTPEVLAAVCHLAAVALATDAMRLWFPPRRDQSGWVLPTLVAGFCLPAPIAGQLLCLLFGRMLATEPLRLREDAFQLGELEALTEHRLETERRTPQSVLDILRGRDANLRRRAVLALRAVDPKRALPVLQKAIQDSDEQVRLQAQTQLNRILSRLELRVKRCEASLAKSTPEPAQLLELAELYHELVFLGLSSEETEQIYLGRAIELLEQALNAQPDFTSARLLLLKCFVKSDNAARAEACLEQLLEAGLRRESLAPWRAEIQFQQRNWGQIRATLETIRGRGAPDARMQGILEFWLEPDPDSPASLTAGAVVARAGRDA